MSIVIVGGNECMSGRYKKLCSEYNYKAKVYPKLRTGLCDIGTPDLVVLFTGTVSHKMVQCVLSKINPEKTCIARSHTSSMAALKNILDRHTA